MSDTETEGLKEISFEQFEGEVWDKSKADLSVWKDSFEKFCNNNPKVELSVAVLEALYGHDIPDILPVNLHLFPESPGYQGEPGHAFDKVDETPEYAKLRGRFQGIVSWVREIRQNKTEERKNEYTLSAVNMMLHEGQHQYLQRSKVRGYFHEVEELPEVIAIKEKIKQHQEGYIGSTKELITSYIDSYTKAILASDISPKSKANHSFSFDFSVHEADVKDLATAVVKADVRKYEGKGPHAIIRNGWQKLLGRLPKGHETINAETAEASLSKKLNKHSVYTIGRSLDKVLIEEYLRDGKTVDQDFILQVWRMVDTYIEDKPE